MFSEVNLWVIYGLLARIASIIILTAWVIPVQWRELKRQYERSKNGGNDKYWRLAFELLFITVVTVTCAIVPITYQGTRIESNSDLTLQNMSAFFTNTIILSQAIGWVRIYRSKYDDRA